ncbi:MAG: Eco57I restriction-modification methylase domain-containing protein [Crocosphaera sp.]|nr:Eco57I restriction-modification methylase domain-containing protein [Crocosphaera sp.]
MISNPISNLLSPHQSLNKAFLKVKPTRQHFEQFKLNLQQLLNSIKKTESEEFNKNLLRDFLKNTYYQDTYFINTKFSKDLVIHTDKSDQSTVGVIIECKKPNNQAEMPNPDKLNVKALQQLLLYFLRERITENNINLKHLIITNVYEWFIFDAQDFNSLFYQDKALVKQFNAFSDKKLTGTTTEFFYKDIAKPAIDEKETDLNFVYVNLLDIRNNEKQLRDLYKFFSPEHLLKLPFINDSNSLDKEFYNELLYIIGLTEVKEKNKKLIKRNKAAKRNSGALIENGIIQLQGLDKLSRISDILQFGDNTEEQLFNVTLELVITWINRILFLKLLEAQLINYHQGDKSFAFLHLDKIKNYSDLNFLFFNVLACENSQRDDYINNNFSTVPYLNSSLFELTNLEHEAIVISNLRQENLPIFSGTVLKDTTGKKRTGRLNALQYLFEFLDAYDFSSEGSEAIQEDNKRLINASVLGLIFEKINGYKDGSFFTPGFITMYMCRETIRRGVIQKFNEVKKWNCNTINDLYNKIDNKVEANQIMNSLKICDPAVGSGHFLVSALNEIIAIKSELKILQDKEGKTLRDYRIEVVNDELAIQDDNGRLFEYNPKNKESQRVQETLFHEKQTIIENCLFGVDINPNSVKICRLRLWIELLKNTYYKGENELETLPNIDINIKCGNSLISRFPLDSDLKVALSKSKSDINTYQTAVQTYRSAKSKQEKREMERLITKIKENFKTTLSGTDPKKVKLRKLASDLYLLENQTTLLEETKTEKKKKEKKMTKLQNEIDKLTVELEDIESGKLYQNAFEWRFEFPEVLNDKGDFVGFDIIIGNPPYIRQEEIKAFKPYLKQEYNCYTGVADLFVYFYEKAYTLLKKKGILTYISSNKYFRSGYGEKLRSFLTRNTTIYTLIDFGDAPVFEEAIAYPSIIVTQASKLLQDSQTINVLNWKVDNSIDDFVTILDQDSFTLQQKDLLSEGWRLESSDVLQLLDKLRNAGTPLGEYVNGRFYYGIKTGFNEAFVIDKETKDRLISEHSSSAEVLKPFLRGRDVKRWVVNFAELYLIKIESSENKKHPWSDKPNTEAETIFSETYPAIYQWLNQYREQLIKRCDQGKYFWELRSCKYWDEFQESKIVWGNLAAKPEFTITNSQYYLTAPANLIVSDNYYLLGVLNSPIIQYLVSQSAASRQGGFLEYKPMYISPLAIPKVTNKQDADITEIVNKIISLKNNNSDADVSHLEKEIDQIVYELYGLTPEEITIVEGSMTK